MPAVMEQVNQLNTLEKLRLMEYLLKTLSVAIVRYEDVEKPKHRRRIGAMDGKWKLPTWEEDKAMDRDPQLRSMSDDELLSAAEAAGRGRGARPPCDCDHTVYGTVFPGVLPYSTPHFCTRRLQIGAATTSSRSRATRRAS